jgi:hypothetical protein
LENERLGFPNVSVAINLATEIRWFDVSPIHDKDATDAHFGENRPGSTSHATAADHNHHRISKSRLPLFANASDLSMLSLVHGCLRYDSILPYGHSYVNRPHSR